MVTKLSPIWRPPGRCRDYILDTKGKCRDMEIVFAAVPAPRVLNALEERPHNDVLKWRQTRITTNEESSGSLGEQRLRSGESACLPSIWPGFNSRTRRHMWVEFVVSSRPCSESFSPSTKINTSKFKFGLETVDERPLSRNATANSHFYL